MAQLPDHSIVSFLQSIRKQTETWRSLKVTLLGSGDSVLWANIELFAFEAREFAEKVWLDEANVLLFREARDFDLVWLERACTGEIVTSNGIFNLYNENSTLYSNYDPVYVREGNYQSYQEGLIRPRLILKDTNRNEPWREETAVFQLQNLPRPYLNLKDFTQSELNLQYGLHDSAFVDIIAIPGMSILREIKHDTDQLAVTVACPNGCPVENAKLSWVTSTKERGSKTLDTISKTIVGSMDHYTVGIHVAGETSINLLLLNQGELVDYHEHPLPFQTFTARATSAGLYDPDLVILRNELQPERPGKKSKGKAQGRFERAVQMLFHLLGFATAQPILESDGERDLLIFSESTRTFLLVECTLLFVDKKDKLSSLRDQANMHEEGLEEYAFATIPCIVTSLPRAEQTEIDICKKNNIAIITRPDLLDLFEKIGSKATQNEIIEFIESKVPEEEPY